MTKTETAGILALIETAYPNIKRSEQGRKEALNLWAKYFENDDATSVLNAVNMYIVSDTTGFPPVIGQIKSKMLSFNPALGEVEAWALVSKACRNGYYHAEEEFNKLPKTVQTTIGSPRMIREWATLDESTLESVIASNFMRAYKVTQTREAEYQALPENERRLLESGQ